MAHHQVDSQTIRYAIHVLERTWVGVADQEELFVALRGLRAALATPLNNDGRSAVIPSAQRVSS